MKIAYASASILPSALANGVHVMKMTHAMARAGHDVRLYAAKGEGWTDDDALCAAYGVGRNFDLCWIPRRGPGPTWNAFYASDVAGSFAREWRPDLVYGRHLYSILLSALKHPDIPVMYEAHILSRTPPQKMAERALFRRKNFRRLVVISDVLKQDYCAAFPSLPADKILVAHDAADPPQAADGAIPALPGRAGAFKACYAGRLIEGKGAGVIAQLCALCPDIDFHLFGGTAEEIAALRKQAGAPTNMLCHGHVAHATLQHYLGAMDVMLAPLQSRVILDKRDFDIGRWTSPLKIFEYMAAGRPIICSDLPVLREVLRDGENALLCAPDSPESWAAALKRLQSDRDLGRNLAARAEDDFLRHHTWLARAKRVLS